MYDWVNKEINISITKPNAQMGRKWGKCKKNLFEKYLYNIAKILKKQYCKNIKNISKITIDM